MYQGITNNGPPLKGVPIISSEIELLENRGAILLTLFSDSEFPWGAILSDFFKVSRSIFLRILALKTQKKSRAYGAILPFRNDQDTVQNRIFSRAYGAILPFEK